MPEVPDPESLADARMAAEQHLQNGGGDPISKAVIKYSKEDIPPAFERIFDVRRTLL